MKTMTAEEIIRKQGDGLPRFFRGKWSHNGSHHESAWDLDYDCGPNAIGSELMTPQDALEQAKNYCNLSAEDISWYADDWSASFKKFK